MAEKAQASGTLVMASAIAVAFIAGVVASYILFDLTAAPARSEQTAGVSAGDAATAAEVDPAAAAAAESELVRLYEGINAQFVDQLRRFSGRLNDIADVAEAEGAATAAQQMREFGAETDDLIQRYDKIAKN